MTAIRTSAEARSSDPELIAWPTVPTAQWRLGFLAGIFDAEGSHTAGRPPHRNGDPEILGHIMESRRTSASAAVLEPVRANGV